MQFSVKIVSQTPKSFPDVKLITCYGTDLAKWGFEDDIEATRQERSKALRDFLGDNLIVFKPQRKMLYDHTEVYSGYDLRLLQKSESFDGRDLIPIPIFSTDVHQHQFSDFVKKLQSKKPVGRIDNIANEVNDTPEYVVWKEAEYEFTVLGEFSRHHYAHGGFSFNTRKKLKAAHFKDEWIDDCYEKDNILYVTREIYSYLSGMISAADPLDLFMELQEKSAQVRSLASEEAAVAVLEKPIVKPKLRMTSMGSPEEFSEEMLMERFYESTQDLGLVYDQRDLFNFHTAMKSSNLVILAGMSGTGKSKLVQAYGRALGLGKQLAFVAVRPSWTDDGDLLGYADTMNKLYRQGDSGLVQILSEANDNPNKMYVVCFDEMNLARVEHYFSQFLSVLEMEEGPKKAIRLYNDQLTSFLENSEQYPPSIPIGNNVIFVGTVNLDESTYHFSDKVLDRANVISLKVMPFVKLRQLPAIDNGQDQAEMTGNQISFEKFESLKKEKGDIELSEGELSLLWDIHMELQQVSQNLGAGPRIVRQIDKYLKNLPENDFLSRKEALDLQLVQRILTKVRGSEEQLRRLIGLYEEGRNSVFESSLSDILDRYASLSEFKETRKVLLHKAKELRINGYTI